MEHPEGVSQWGDELASALPVLSVAQRRVLARWCFAMEQTGLCATHTLAVFLGLALGCAWGTVRQRLREWYWDAEDKQGLDRREVDVRACFAPLARWVLADWPGTPGTRVRVSIALDATSLGDRLTILAVSIVYKGCTVPVAWKILPAARKRAWNPEWVALLALVAPAFPRDWQVIVLTDRGLYSRVLYRAIVGHGWHPFMRVNIRGTFQPTGSDQRRRIADFTPRVGTACPAPSSPPGCGPRPQGPLAGAHRPGPPARVPSPGTAPGTGLNKASAPTSAASGTGSTPA